MFASRYFNPRYWAARYWPKIGGIPLIDSPDCIAAVNGFIEAESYFTSGITISSSFNGTITAIEPFQGKQC